MSLEWRKGAGGRAHTTAGLAGSPATTSERSSPVVSGALAEWTDAFPLGEKEQKEMRKCSIYIYYVLLFILICVNDLGLSIVILPYFLFYGK